MRNILKCVFEMNSLARQEVSGIAQVEQVEQVEQAAFSYVDMAEDPVTGQQPVDNAQEAMPDDSPLNFSAQGARSPAVWIPDEVTANCMDCSMPFTLVRRRHHCRKCGKIFCSRCSCHWMSLPQEGYSQPVRVCNSCFLCNVSSVVEGMVHTC